MSAPLSVGNRKSDFSLLWLLLHGGAWGRRAHGSVKWELLAKLCEGQGRQRGGAGGLLPVWGGNYQKNGREGRSHKGCRQSSQNGQTENEGMKDEVGGILSPVLHPELQVCCSILCSSGINVVGWVVPTANLDNFSFCLPCSVLSFRLTLLELLGSLHILSVQICINLLF